MYRRNAEPQSSLSPLLAAWWLRPGRLQAWAPVSNQHSARGILIGPLYSMARPTPACIGRTAVVLLRQNAVLRCTLCSFCIHAQWRCKISLCRCAFCSPSISASSSLSKTTYLFNITFDFLLAGLLILQYCNYCQKYCNTCCVFSIAFGIAMLLEVKYCNTQKQYFLNK